ncbi:hypothetical protein OAM67_01375 [bacterium]|nr:hypothetical protein [bacterium]
MPTLPDPVPKRASGAKSVKRIRRIRMPSVKQVASVKRRRSSRKRSPSQVTTRKKATTTRKRSAHQLHKTKKSKVQKLKVQKSKVQKSKARTSKAPDEPKALRNFCYRAMFPSDEPRDSRNRLLRVRHGDPVDCARSMYFTLKHMRQSLLFARKRFRSTRDPKTAIAIARYALTKLQIKVRRLEARTGRRVEPHSTILVLGKLEDIYGFFELKHMVAMKKIKPPYLLRNLLGLATDSKKWSTALNRDFIQCGIAPEHKTGFLNRFAPMPLVLVGTTTDTLNEYSPRMTHPRVTHCEIQWIKDALRNEPYNWETTSYKNALDDTSNTHKLDVHIDVVYRTK